MRSNASFARPAPPSETHPHTHHRCELLGVRPLAAPCRVVGDVKQKSSVKLTAVHASGPHIEIAKRNRRTGHQLHTPGGPRKSTFLYAGAFSGAWPWPSSCATALDCAERRRIPPTRLQAIRNGVNHDAWYCRCEIGAHCSSPTQ